MAASQRLQTRTTALRGDRERPITQIPHGCRIRFLFDELCRVAISRFRRDRSVFDGLDERVLPELAGIVAARGGRELRCWCAGCASGEEAYTLRILWELGHAHRHPSIRFRIVATDQAAGQEE